MNEDPQIDPREFSEAIQELRDEMQRDVRGLATCNRASPETEARCLAAGCCRERIGPYSSVRRECRCTTNIGSAGNPQLRRPMFEPNCKRPWRPTRSSWRKITQSLVAAQQAATEDFESTRACCSTVWQDGDESPEIRRSAERGVPRTR